MRKNKMRLHRAVRFLAFGLLLLTIPTVLCSTSSAQIGVSIGISVRIGPPALPVYEQPICPGAGYLFTPGYWAWDDDGGYYWVPGTWVVAPVGLLWTPGYWGWNNGVYAWNGGYWGPHIGFYGGINYGFGYGGVGFGGGEWRGGAFFYNTAVMNVNTTQITNVYVNKTVIVNNESHVAFNGGEGGVTARPTPAEETAAREPHTPPVGAQVQQEHSASQNKALFASNNHGAPAVAATAKPGEFSGRGVVAAKAAGAPYHAPAMSPKEARASAPAGKSSPAPKEAKTPNPANKSNPSSSRPENASKGGETSAHPPAKPSTPTPSSHASTPPRAAKSGAASESPAAPKPRPAPKESAPKASAPKPSHSAPKPQKQSPPPKKESEPK